MATGSGPRIRKSQALSIQNKIEYILKSDPVYLRTLSSGLWDQKIEKLYAQLEACQLCPRKCRANRSQGETGYCRAGSELIISSYGPHFGEEEPLVGLGAGSGMLATVFGISRAGGSGTIFLTLCNLLCSFCQNFDISHLGEGQQTSPDKAAKIMLHLQASGCHNINFVTPTHFAPHLVESIKIAAKQGLRLPIVWNCGGYENVEIIKILDGIVDIYMPDFKFGSNEAADRFCKAPDYFERCAESVKEMFRQVGDLKMDERGIAYKGLLIRHLVMPNAMAGSEKILKFIAEELSPHSYVNIMSQYRPTGNAYQFKEINRYPTQEEYEQVISTAIKLGLQRGFQKKHLDRF